MFVDALEKRFSELGSTIHQVALYKGLICLRDEVNQEVSTQFKSPVIGAMAITSLQLEIDEAILAIERVLEKKNKEMLAEIKQHL